MKRNLLKTLLVAVVLLVGNMNVWAATKTLYPTGSTDPTATANWSWYTAQMTATQNTGYISFESSGNGTRVAYLPFYTTGNDFYSTYESYTVSFDFYTTKGWANASGSSTAEVVMYAEGATIKTPLYYTFTSQNTSKKNYQFLMAGSGTYDVLSMATNGGAAVTYSDATWYTASITVTKNEEQYDVAYSVKTQDGNTTMASGSTTNITSDGTSYKCQGIMLCLGKYCKEVRIANVQVTTEVTGEVVSDPTIDVAYAGANRTVTITAGTSSASNEVTTYYTTDGTDPTSSSSVYSSALNISEACTVKAISISSASKASNISSQAVTVGKLTLNAPTFTKTGYSAGSYTVAISQDQSGLEYVPASSTIKYRIGTSGEYSTYSSAVSVDAGKTLYAYVEADNYTNSSEASIATGVQPTFATDWSLDFTSGSVSYATTTFDGYYNLLDGSSNPLNTKFGVSATENSNVNKWYINKGGLYCYYSGARAFALQNLAVGQYVRITTSVTPDSYGSALTLQDEISYQHTYTFYVATAGTSWIKLPRNTYLYKVEVLNPAVSKTVTAAGWATYCSTNALDFSDVDGLTAYQITGASGTSLTLEEITGTVAANTGILLAGEAGNYAIPVVATGTDYSSTNKLVGVTSETADVAAGIYVLMNETTGEARGVGFYQTLNAFTVGANTAYLPSNFAAAREFYLFEGETTGINAVKSAENNVQGEVYNLAGQRVAQPTKGLYIVNGKKVVIK